MEQMAKDTIKESIWTLKTISYEYTKAPTQQQYMYMEQG